MSEHSPLPWRINRDFPGHLEIWANGERGPYKRAVAVLPQQSGHPKTPHETTDANAEFIVNACNAYDDLLEACEVSLERLVDADYDYGVHPAVAAVISHLRSVINTVEGL